MAPGFNSLREDDGNESEEELDLTGWSDDPQYEGITCLWLSLDLKAQYEVRLEQGLDAFVVIDGLPLVPEDSKQKLVKFLLKKLNTVGKTKEDAIFMPLDDKKMSEGYE
jgi:translation initiation factor 3 subunit B